MSAGSPETTENYSKGARAPRAARRGPGAIEAGLAALGLAGAACLVAASVTPVVRLAVPASAGGGPGVEAASTGLDRHGPALLLVAAFAAVLLVPALRGVRAAMAALGVAGLLALGIAVADDVPALDESGPLTVLGERAQAGAGPGFYLETLGGVLLVLAAGGLLLLGGPPRAAGPAPAPGPDARTPPEGAAPGPARARHARSDYQR